MNCCYRIIEKRNKRILKAFFLLLFVDFYSVPHTTQKISRKPLFMEMSQPLFGGKGSLTINQESESTTTLHRNESATT